MGTAKKINLCKLILLNLSFYVSIRMVPTVASGGWHSMFFIIMAGLLFATPISLVCAELATTWPEVAGPHVWVKLALGEKYAFLVACLIWLETFLGIIMVSSGFATLISFALSKPELGRNPKFVVTIIILITWIITFLNLKTKINKLMLSIAPIIGIYIPYIIIIILGLWYAIKYGNVNLGVFSLKDLLPDSYSIHKYSFFSGIVFIFAGLEIASVHADDIESPNKHYPKVVFLTISFVILFNLLAGLTEANSVPHNDIQLASITQMFALYFKILNISWITNIIAIIIAISVFTQLRSWALRPSDALLNLIDEYNLNNNLAKKNKLGLPVNLLIFQSVSVSLISLIYLVVSNVNVGFFMILILATIIYCIVYVFILISEIILRYKKASTPRPFSVPGGIIGMWVTVILAFSGILLTITFGLIPPDIIPKSEYYIYIIFEIIGTLISILIPIYIFMKNKIFTNL